MQRKIQLLAPCIAERIAAGEIIERPSSVVKELLENSLDAGATEIAILLENGGRDLIEIIDNGHGMPPDDLELSIERHATSKLSSLEDLEKIVTLGFRGEALPSIAAVSDLTIVSRSKNSDTAYELKVGDISGRLIQKPRAEKVTFGRFIASPHGVRMKACGLFSQMPARLKFLRSQAAEVSQVREWTERIALAYPHVGFRLVSDDRTLINLRPQSQEERIQAVLSDGDKYPLVTASNEFDSLSGLSIRVHWLQGLSVPTTRRLIQIVNSRTIRDRLIQQALLGPFRQALMPGQFPAIALFVDINPAAIDVNVHPTKSEIRFLESRKVFHAIESLVKSMIVRQGSPSVVPLRSGLQLPSQSAPSQRPPWEFGANEYSQLSEPLSLWKASERGPILESSGSGDPNLNVPTGIQNRPPLSIRLPEHLEDGSIQAPELPAFSPCDPLASARYVGVLFNTYLLYEEQHEMILVDQHAAHERIRYEALRKRVLNTGEEPLSSQALLIPEVVRITLDSRPLIEGRIEWLSHLGFEVEVFSEDTLLFRGVPPEWGSKNLKIRLKNLVERVVAVEVDSAASDSRGGGILLDEALFESLASEACHSAIRAGDHLEVEEIGDLSQQLFRCEHPWNCPHGRPTVVRMPKGKLEEWFQRKM